MPPFELDDLQMSEGDLIAFAAWGLVIVLGMLAYPWVRIRMLRWINARK